MKSLQEIIAQESLYINDWSNLEDLTKDFELSPQGLEDCKILFASYGCECYTGEAFVLVAKNNELFEVNGSHCSCYGLENQWSLEEVVLKELEHRLVSGRLGTSDYCGNAFAKELKEFLGIE